MQLMQLMQLVSSGSSGPDTENAWTIDPTILEKKQIVCGEALFDQFVK